MIATQHAKAVLVLVVLAVYVPDLQAKDKDKEPGKAPLTLSLALKLGPENLTKYTDDSEAGQDQAAGLYAIARQIETEQALAKKDLTQVAVLRDWRDAISACRRDACTLAYIINGGGTMYSHGQARDVSAVEDFLAELAKCLPLAEGKGGKTATKTIDANIAFFKTLKPLDAGDEDSNKDAKAKLAAAITQTIEHWESLRYSVDAISGDEATKIAAFTSESLGWLKE